MRRLCLFLCLVWRTNDLSGQDQALPHKLLVISIDGLDARYLRNADALGLKIPNLRRLKAEGTAAEGVMGIVPTVTWPSHTTLVTGVGAEEHGIVSNDQPGQPGQRWWFTRFLKSRTLWQAALEKKLKVATVYWPVTAGAEVNFNFPEFWEQRTEHEILFEPIAKRATAGLVERVASVYPSFRRSRWTDTTGMQAVRYLLEFENPDLTLVHIADLDSEQHEMGAFTPAAKAVLESQDELIGWVLEKLPRGTIVAIVSDHGFENADQMVRPRVMLQQAGIQGSLTVSNGLIGTPDSRVAGFFRKQAGKNGIAREVPIEEVHEMAPSLKEWLAAFETMPGYVASADEKGPALSEGNHKGLHGLWPSRPMYRASFLIWGEGVRRSELGEISMLQIGPTFANILNVLLPEARQASLWPALRK